LTAAAACGRPGLRASWGAHALSAAGGLCRQMVAGRAGRGVIAAQPGPAIACFSTSMLAPGLLDDDIACSMCSNAFCLSAVGRATALVDDIARSISASASSFAALDITYRYGSLVCVVNKRLTDRYPYLVFLAFSFGPCFFLDSRRGPHALRHWEQRAAASVSADPRGRDSQHREPAGHRNRKRRPKPPLGAPEYLCK